MCINGGSALMQSPERSRQMPDWATSDQRLKKTPTSRLLADKGIRGKITGIRIYPLLPADNLGKLKVLVGGYAIVCSPALCLSLSINVAHPIRRISKRREEQSGVERVSTDNDPAQRRRADLEAVEQVVQRLRAT
ncbi:hypothetical protein T09_12422 [Trichinella sp. T9]|nr:hypothetical protein T09_12422 [Trichinella sp. T9]